MNKISKLTFGIVGAVVAIGLLIAKPSTVRAEDTLRVMSFGGAFQDAQRKAVFEPFEKATGIKIVESTWFGDIGKIKAMVEANNVTADVVLGDVGPSIAGCNEGYLVSFPPGTFGDPKDYLPNTLYPCGIPTEFTSILFAYSEEKIPAAWGSARPTKIADLFDTVKFPGKRAFSVRVIGGLIEKILLADGVPPDQIYKVLSTPAGLDRVFAKLDSMKNDIVWYTSNAQPLQLLASGEVAMIQSANGRIYSAVVNENKKFVPVWDGQVYYPDVWLVPKGANTDLAVKFLKFHTEPKAMAALTKYIPYGPVRTSAAAFVDEGTKPYLTTSHLKDLGVSSDMQWWADNQTDVNDRFQAWLAKK